MLVEVNKRDYRLQELSGQDSLSRAYRCLEKRIQLACCTTLAMDQRSDELDLGRQVVTAPCAVTIPSRMTTSDRGREEARQPLRRLTT